MKYVETNKAPAAIGPYSQAIIHEKTLYCSGQIPIDPATGNAVEGGVSEQAEQIMKNIEAVLTAAGTSYDKVIKTTCFLYDMADFATFNQIYEKWFTSKPARSCVAVKGLPKGVMVEIEVIASL